MDKMRVFHGSDHIIMKSQYLGVKVITITEIDSIQQNMRTEREVGRVLQERMKAILLV